MEDARDKICVELGGKLVKSQIVCQELLEGLKAWEQFMEDTCDRAVWERMIKSSQWGGISRLREGTFSSMKRVCYGWRWFPDPKPPQQPSMMNGEAAASAIAAVPTQGVSRCNGGESPAPFPLDPE